MRLSDTYTHGYAPLSAESDSDGNVELKPIFPNGEYHLWFVNPPGVHSYPALEISFFPQEPGETIDLGEKRVQGDFTAYEP